MTDREYIISRTLEHKIAIAENNNQNTLIVSLDVLKEILILLKEQGPVLLKDQHKPGGHFINANSPWISRCPRCGKKIEGRQTRFCKYCGKAVKWV